MKAPPEPRRGPVAKIGIGALAKRAVEIAHLGEIGVRNPVVAALVHGLREHGDRDVAHHFGRGRRERREHQIRIERGGSAASVARRRAFVDDAKFLGLHDARRHRVLPFAGRQNSDVRHPEHHHLQDVRVVPLRVENFPEEVFGVFPLLGEFPLRNGASLKGVRVGRRDRPSLEIGERFERASRSNEEDGSDRAVRFLSVRAASRRDLLQTEVALAHSVAARQNHEAVGSQTRRFDRLAPREFDRGEAILRIAGLEALDERRIGVDEETRIEGVDDPDRDVHGFARRCRFIRPHRKGSADGQDAAEKESEGRKEPHECREQNFEGIIIIRSRSLTPRSADGG